MDILFHFLYVGVCTSGLTVVIFQFLVGFKSIIRPRSLLIHRLSIPPPTGQKEKLTGAENIRSTNTSSQLVAIEWPPSFFAFYIFGVEEGVILLFYVFVFGNGV